MNKETHIIYRKILVETICTLRVANTKACSNEIRNALDIAIADGAIDETECDIFLGWLPSEIEKNFLLMLSIVDKPRADYEGFFNRIHEDSERVKKLIDTIDNIYYTKYA
jgi:hypothetical protein